MCCHLPTCHLTTYPVPPVTCFAPSKSYSPLTSLTSSLCLPGIIFRYTFSMTVFLLLPLLLLNSFGAGDTLSPCSSFTSQGYDCVPYYLCKDGYIVTDGEGVIDPRGLGRRRQVEKAGTARIANSRPEDALCPVVFDVCCRDLDFSAPHQNSKPTTAASPSSSGVVTCEALRPDTTVSVFLFCRIQDQQGGSIVQGRGCAPSLT